MNDERARSGPSANSTRLRSVPERSVLLGVIGLRELIADGTRYEDGALPAEIVGEVDAGLAGLERDLDRELNPPVLAPPPERVTCGECGLVFTWPGQLDHHLRFVHEEQGEAA